MNIKTKMSALVVTFALAFSFVSVVPTISPLSASAEGNWEIDNPYAHVDWDTYNQYKAGTHNHTTNSDGDNSPRSAAEEMYRWGYNIVSFNDHSYTTIRPGEARNGGSALSVKRMNEMAAGLGENGRGGKDGMMFIPGTNEHSGLSFPTVDALEPGRGGHHINTYWSTFNSRSESVHDLLDRVASEGTGLAVINHPGRYTGSVYVGGDMLNWEAARANTVRPVMVNSYTDLFRDAPFAVGMEIINKFDAESQSDRVLWDKVLTNLMPEGRKVWGFSSDDAHINRSIGYSYNIMLMPELSMPEYRYAMESGAFFAYSRVDRQYKIWANGIPEWEWEGRALSTNTADSVRSLPTVDVSRITAENDVISITTSAANTVKWYTDGGTLIHTGASLDLNLYASSIVSYVRASVSNSNYGVLYVQPFGVSPAGTERAFPVLKSVNGTLAGITTDAGALPTESGLNLPSGVAVTTTDSDGTETLRPAAVLWDLANVDYVPALRLQKQTFTVKGTVRLNGIANPDDVSLDVSVEVTVNECNDCYVYDEIVWSPDFTDRTVEGKNVGGDLGILLSNAEESTAAFIGNTLHLTALSSRNRSVIIYTSDTDAGVSAGWNPVTSFAPSDGTRYTATFTASVAYGSGGARVQTRIDGEDARISTDYDLNSSPQTITYSWTQNPNEQWRIDTRNTPIGVALIISNIKITTTHTLCDGRCVETPPERDWSVTLGEIDELAVLNLTNISEEVLSTKGLVFLYEHGGAMRKWKLPALIIRQGETVNFAQWRSTQLHDPAALKWTRTSFAPTANIRLADSAGNIVS
ncbi:MAG: hypothetical protein FWG45_03470 [Oscillospiraceae bacterium]|nr:hypothetical protein [Oscillospiraceae bacterium]